MAASQCWLQGIDSIYTAAASLQSQPVLDIKRRSPLTDFIQLQTFEFCQQLASASVEQQRRLKGAAVAHLHVWHLFPLLDLLLTTRSEASGKLHRRSAAGQKQSFFESATEFSCVRCAEVLQQSVILRALRSTAFKRTRVEWNFLVDTIFKAEFMIPYAALLLFTELATSAIMESSKVW
jgi:hypothetical protein